MQKIEAVDEKRKRGTRKEGGPTGQKVWKANQEHGGGAEVRGWGLGQELGYSLQDPRSRPGRGWGRHTRTGS